MKKNRKYFFIGLALAVAVVFLVKYFIASRHIEVVKGSSIMVNNNEWNYIVANYVNMSGIKVTVDGTQVKLEENSIYMDEHRNLLVSQEVLTKLLSCATNRYFNNMLVTEKGTNRLIFTAGSSIVSVNGEDEDVNVASTVIDGVMYIPFRQICKNFSYDYEWNYENNTIAISNTKPDEKIYPYSYDFRTDGKVMKVRNQANYGTCWAFASLTALSTSILPEINYEFSVDHMSYHSGYNLSPAEGGEYTMAMAYLAAWKGPVLEIEDPYGDGQTSDDLQAIMHVQEMQIIESKDFNEIKKSVFLYGGVQSSLYMSVNDANGIGSEYYNPEKSAYCYIGMEKPNHDIVIVGWDDSYSADNFASKPEGDGAFICVNSWGEDFGENGYFYVSYYDSNIGIYNVVYTDVEKNDNYDNIYQSDELGWVGQIGYSKESAYFANVFSSDKDEILEAVGFYATGTDTEYEVYAIDNFKDTNSFNSKKLVAKGSFSNAGYYTVKFDEAVEMKADQKMAVVVYISTPNSVHPIAIEFNSGETTEGVDTSDGEGYISSNGKNWERVEETQNCNLCLKFYTNNIDSEVEVE